LDTVAARLTVSSFSIFIALLVSDRALSAVAGGRAIALRLRPTLGASAEQRGGRGDEWTAVS
jgi:hypothetical protein